jgi:hypothetical protein
VLHETLTLAQALGAFLILLGVVLVEAGPFILAAAAARVRRLR